MTNELTGLQEGFEAVRWGACEKGELVYERDGSAAEYVGHIGLIVKLKPGYSQSFSLEERKMMVVADFPSPVYVKVNCKNQLEVDYVIQKCTDIGLQAVASDPSWPPLPDSPAGKILSLAIKLRNIPAT